MPVRHSIPDGYNVRLVTLEHQFLFSRLNESGAFSGICRETGIITYGICLQEARALLEESVRLYKEAFDNRDMPCRLCGCEESLTVGTYPPYRVYDTKWGPCARCWREDMESRL